jgi:hypothetical protein
MSQNTRSGTRGFPRRATALRSAAFPRCVNGTVRGRFDFAIRTV